MKTKKELNVLKEEVKALNEEFRELTDEELVQVTGGADTEFPCSVNTELTSPEFSRADLEHF